MFILKQGDYYLYLGSEMKQERDLVKQMERKLCNMVLEKKILIFSSYYLQNI